MKEVILYFDDIDCAACASEVEEELKKIKGVNECSLSFLDKKVRLVFDEEMIPEKELLDVVNRQAKRAEPDVNFSYQEFEEMSANHEACHTHHHHHDHDEDEEDTVVLYFDDIDCAACAKEVEERVSKEPGVIKCELSYLDKKMQVTYDDKIIPDENFLDVINKAAKEAEPDVNFTFEKVVFEKEENEAQDKKKKVKVSSILFFVGAFLAILAVILQLTIKDNQTIKIVYSITYVVSYLLMSYKIILKSFKNILRGKIFDETFLMTISSIGAMCLGEFFEGCMLALLYTIGEYFQDKAVDKSTAQIASLTSLKVEKATLINGDIIDTKMVKVGDEIIVNKGERVPLDGVILQGASFFDYKALTGESTPVQKVQGEEVLSGAINTTDMVEIKVSKLLEESTSSKIIKMVEEASLKKAKSEEFITRFSKIYTPAVIGLAVVVLLVQWLFIPTIEFKQAVNNAIVFLVSSCPCALIISVPLAIFAGIGRCSSVGILTKGGNYLEALAKLEAICFDKTGTLTKGTFEVADVSSSDEDLMNKLAVNIEKFSNHPIAQAIRRYKNVEEIQLDDLKEVAGKGLKALYNGKEVLVGNDKLLNDASIDYQKNESVGTIVYVAYDQKFIGSYVIKDEIKEDTMEMMSELEALKIKSYMFTGDSKKIAESIGAELGITCVKSELLPDDKLHELTKVLDEKDQKKNIAYVGDGINDTPALKLADVGIAIGGFGHDEAMETADVVLMANKMTSIPEAIKIAKFTHKITVENIVIALTIKLAVLIIATIGILPSYGMFLGVFADVGVCLIDIVNSLRILKKKNFGVKHGSRH